ncbi:4-phosphoerythronate dehydrogenase PdxB [Halomonas llamarensis]|uniref:Erythronate-4-phosphate dehydrogenase n=1 Tax=Halomonas llamarensis TaxID=2945104 RepID=A0ABT0SSD4_9GAMM|nr:4-phosphoerythronate dehydrogenase PdxB [Halomonas llamarensis]MCL7930478.1 4-phosphoerythronate dehydrogenase PdxB [Halomonas llamarensis]
MKLVVDANIPAADACFGAFGEVIKCPGREISAEHLRDADALIIRSVTPVNASLLAESAVRFVGTCTIGIDHVDTHYLAEHDIAFASAPGCNAEAVVDYVLASLLTLAERQGWRLLDRCVGIVGVGNVGSRLQARLQALGVEVLACDPPRAEREGVSEGKSGFTSLETLIEHCDVLCLHTPLVSTGPHATQHLLDAERITELAHGMVVLNAGRGDCIDGLALRSRLASQNDLTAVLDVWENEPAIDAALHDLAMLATPHIAGYSLDGKLRGSLMIHQALAAHLDQTSELTLDDICPPPALASITLQQALPSEDALRLCARAVYDVRHDHERLTREAHALGLAKGFDTCRANYPLRREFSTLTVRLRDEAQTLATILSVAGFTVVLA